MKKIVCVASKNSVGCTFLDWSINYISGQTKFLNYQSGWSSLSNNPITNINAHNHPKNHPRGLDQTKECVSILTQQSNFSTVFPSIISLGQAASALNYNLSTVDSDEIKQLLEYRDHDYNSTLKWLQNQGVKIIYVSSSNQIPLYLTIENRSMGSDRSQFTGKKIKTLEDYRQENDQLYFRDSVKKWQELELTDIWDVRERMALNCRPFKKFEENVDFSIEHFWIDCQDLWFLCDERILEIFQWLDLTVDRDRYSQWLPVYDKWRKLQAKTVFFQRTYQHIVDCIINGWSYPIDLSFNQEVVIQHLLIYQHNLNLKTWQLEKFPGNTKDLHSLLEPNTHPVPKIY